MSQKLTNRIIKLLGGYTKDDILSEAMSELFNVISEDDILRENPDGSWSLGGKPLAEEIQKQIVAESQVFVKTRLWQQVLQYDAKYQSNKIMFEKSKTEVDMLGGKMLLYLLDIFKTRLKSLNKGKGHFNSDARQG